MHGGRDVADRDYITPIFIPLFFLFLTKKRSQRDPYREEKKGRMDGETEAEIAALPIILSGCP